MTRAEAAQEIANLAPRQREAVAVFVETANVIAVVPRSWGAVADDGIETLEQLAAEIRALGINSKCFVETPLTPPITITDTTGTEHFPDMP